MPRDSKLQLIGQLILAFSDWRPLRHVEDPLHKDLSAVARAGDSLFLACDETASVERLRRMKDGSFGEHQHFVLDARGGVVYGPPRLRTFISLVDHCLVIGGARRS